MVDLPDPARPVLPAKTQAEIEAENDALRARFMASAKQDTLARSKAPAPTTSLSNQGTPAMSASVTPTPTLNPTQTTAVTAGLSSAAALLVINWVLSLFHVAPIPNDIGMILVPALASVAHPLIVKYLPNS